MTLSPEQNKVLSRCKSMLKRAFPEIDVKFTFRLDCMRLGEKGVSVSVFIPDLKTAEMPDSEKGCTVADMTL